MTKQPIKQQAGQARQFKPAVVQSKNRVGVSNGRRPGPPPVYSPNPMPRVAQAKSAAPAKTKAGPTAPAVYRAQPIPRCMQTKSVKQVQPGARVTGHVQARMAVPNAPAAARAGGGIIQMAEPSKEEKKARRFSLGFMQVGHSDKPMPPGGMATYGQLAIVVDDGGEDATITLGASKNIKGEHAEDVIMRILSEHSGMFDPSTVNQIHVSVTKSPCSSDFKTSKKAKGCTESLIDLVKHGYPLAGHMVKFKLTLHVAHLYGGSGDRKRNSCLALKELKKAGAEINLANNTIVSGETCDL